jgi:phage FluMu gp28-like protein
VVVDETGVGAGAVEMLEADVGRRLVEGVKFTIDRKQSLYNSLKAALDNGSVTLPDDRLLRQELTDLEYEMTRGGKTKIGHPDGGHDDHPDALALAVSDITDADSGYASTSDNVVVL